MNRRQFWLVFVIVALVPVSVSAQWQRRNLGSLVTAWSVSAADLDGDSDIDVAATGWNPGELAWFRNNGTSFTKVTIEAPMYRPRAIFLADLNRDSDIDILTVTDDAEDQVFRFDNNGSASFTRYTVGSLNDGEDVFAVDLDKDSDVDVVAAALWGYEVAWFENNGSQVFTKHSIETTTAPVYAVWPVDLDRDSDIDIISGIGLNGAGVWWYENDGSQTFTKRMIDAGTPLNDVWPGDIDGDGDIDFFTAAIFGDAFFWYENDGSQGFTKHMIAAGANPISIYGADFDGDSDIDAVGAELVEGKVVLFYNDGNENFARVVLDNTVDMPAEVFVVDLDRDSDPDVLAAIDGDDIVLWYENLRPSGSSEPPHRAGPELLSSATFVRDRICIRLASGLERPGSIRLCDRLGRKLCEQPVPAGETEVVLEGVATDQLGAGVYFLELGLAGSGRGRRLKLVRF